ncbi:MAG: Hpt domain-containing protein [Acaryochloridaceae cyanobacterium RU_4_10]|nr:Hpt domain-containing protein [Acaryochloridaceae cyanobacterium RU_4_10]
MSLLSFDWRQLQAATGGDRLLEREILELFVRHTETQLQVLSEAWDRREFKILVQVAHQLRGSCSNVGALTLDRTMAEIEDYAVLEKEIDLERLMKSLGPAFAQTVSEIHHYSGQTV